MEKLYNVLDFGSLFEGENVTEEQKWSNTKIIQAALDAAGQSGGGTVVLPKGTYYLNGNYDAGGVPNLPENDQTAVLYISYSNTTLEGAGMYKTRLCTPGEYKVINGKVKRVYGIRIVTSVEKEINNITIKDLELIGGTHGTGRIHWPADIETGDGWDITHKGIVMHGGYAGNIILDHLCVHGYRGELMYADTSVRSVTVTHCKTYDTNAQCYNFSAQKTLVENCHFGDDEYPCNTWIEYANYNRFDDMEDGCVIFRNNYFTGNRHNTVSFNEGHNDHYEIYFENNYLDLRGGKTYNGVACFVFDGGTSGPVHIRNNTIVSRDGSISVINTDCWEGRHRYLDENFLIENNHFIGFRALLSFASAYGSPNPERMLGDIPQRQHKNMVIRNNIVDALEGDEARPVVILGNNKETMIDYLDNRWQSKTLPYFEKILIENNTFNNCITPWIRDFYGTCAVFRDNLYNNPILKLGSNSSYSAIQEVSEENNRVVPVFEYLKVKAEKEVKVRLRTHNPMDLRDAAYEDGVEALITGDNGTSPIIFMPDDTNTFKENLVITENNYMRIRYNREMGKWDLIEMIDEKLNYVGAGADISKLIGIDTSVKIGNDDTVIK